MRMRMACWTLVLSLVLAFGCGGDGGNAFKLGKSSTIEVNPDPISFGSVAINTEIAQIVTIENFWESTHNLTIDSVYLSNTTSSDFSITQPALTVLAPGESTEMEVIYRPTDSKYDAGELVINFNSATGAPKIVPISSIQQSGQIVATPSPISFGSVGTNDTKTIAVRLQNIGSDSLNIGSTLLAYTSDPTFSVQGIYDVTNDTCDGLANGTERSYPFIMGPSEAYCVDVLYSPVGGGAHNGLLQVYPPPTPESPNPYALGEFPVNGTQIGPEITIMPSINMDFGAVEIGAEKTLTFDIQNDGNQDLVVGKVIKGAAQANTFEAVNIDTAVATNTVVSPGVANALTVSVTFKPTQGYPVTFTAIGTIEVYSNDGDEGIATVNVFGKVAAPQLQVTPADMVDFGVVALNAPSDRTLTFTNLGTVAMNISSLAISQNSPANEFEIVNAAGLPGDIAPAGAATVQLRFTNKGGPENDIVWGTLSFQSDDPSGPTEVSLKATRANVAQCKVILNPVSLNYGTVPYGYEKTMSLNIVNVGSAPCSWSHATVHDGAAGPFGGMGGCTAGPVSNSNSFAIVEQPPAVKDLIKPGMSWPLEIKFVPQGNMFSGTFDDFAGLVQVHLLDFSTGSPVEITSPEAAAGQQATCNLQGKSGIANIAAIPGEVDFGVTTVGCHSQTTTIKIYNTGDAPLSLCNIKLEGCTPEVKLKNVPPIPQCTGNGGGINLSMGNPVEVDVVYAPQDLSKDGCALLIESNDLDTPALTVPLSGQGTYDDFQVDEFTQLSGQMVDVLFVVDNSGSMGDEQNSLAANFQNFITSATSQWQTDYHLGVITTDMDEGNALKGQLMGDPRYVTLADPVSKFSSNVKVGANGSGTERGLAAMHAALSLPLTGKPDPAVPCQSDADCSAPAKCVLEQGTKQCGGYNMGFVREDATLEVVFVSDEDDASSAALSFYIDFLKTIKGFANDNLMHAHSIVGDPGQGCDGSGGSADSGDRYFEVSKQTGGKYHSICDSNWAYKLEDIGNVAFGLKVQFFLSRPAVPDTIAVMVDGVPCAAGWSYQADSNSVIFDENGGCMPIENQKISISYEVICYSS